MELKKLFKKDTKGKIRFLSIESIDDEIHQTSGIVGGKPSLRVSKCVAKNVGRSNETTASEQAELEAKAKHVKKLKEGYFESEDEAKNEFVILPMLAKVYEKEAHKIDWSSAWVQPKLDGMRCLDTYKGKISRKNTPIDTMDHIVFDRPEKCSLVHGRYSDVVLDGELYAHGLSFQENMKLIKKLRPESSSVKYHVYDLVSHSPFIARYNLLKELISDSSNIELVPAYRVRSFEDVAKYHAQFLDEGYEGTMVRWGEEGYKVNGRSSNLLKLKTFHDIALVLKDVVPSKKRPTHGKPIFGWRGATNNELGAGISLSHAEAEDLLANKDKHIGKVCELRFFEYSDTGVPRFPVMHGFRLDK